MSHTTEYLYDNTRRRAKRRLTGLEGIEDEGSISLLSQLGPLEGKACLEVGAGAGSIAQWLSHQVGPTGRVVATDIEPALLDSRHYEVLKHNIETDRLPRSEFDLVHVRHLLIHLSKPDTALKELLGTTKQDGFLLVEESDLLTWAVIDTTPSSLGRVFTSGVAAVLEIYRSGGIDVGLGSMLATKVERAGFEVRDLNQRVRLVEGGSSEAQYQSMTVEQLSKAPGMKPRHRDRLLGLVECLANRELRYRTRTTVSVSAVNSKGAESDLAT